MNPSDEILEQIEVIRADGPCNMLDYNCVISEANARQFYDLVTWMADIERRGWATFVLSGGATRPVGS
jgi:hypothetical protein